MFFSKRRILSCFTIALLLAGCSAPQQETEEGNADGETPISSAGGATTSATSSWAGEDKVPGSDPDKLLTTAVEYAKQGYAAPSRDAAASSFLQAAAHAKKLELVDPQLVSSQKDFFSNMYYKGACALSVQGNPELAMAALENAVEMGFSDFDYMMTDDDLAAVRELSSFGDELENWKALE
ncbi:MAG: hypothetical protein VB855_14375 [Pirellulaceae bacterium]